MISKINIFVEKQDHVNKDLNTENTKRMGKRDRVSIIATVLLISRIAYFFLLSEVLFHCGESNPGLGGESARS